MPKCNSLALSDMKFLMKLFIKVSLCHEAVLTAQKDLHANP